MKRSAFAASLLLFASAPTVAEWIRIGENAGAVSYVDSFVVKDGDLRKATELLDLRERAPTGELSRRGLWECDCTKQRARMVSLSLHSERMGKGTVLVTVNTRGDWSEVPADTIGAALLSFACGR